MTRRDYEHPYPSPTQAAEHPFVPLDFERRALGDMRARAADFHDEMARRRSVRMIAADPVPLDLVETAIATASTAPSGAHLQPWRFVVTGDPEIKRQIREAAEEEERTNYLDQRMNEEWQEALAPLGTDWHKEFLEIAPWIVVLFEQRWSFHDDGSKRSHYYVKESCGIAAGLFITALHHAGLVTLTHTPTPMAFLNRVLDRPRHERPFVLFPVGYPTDGVLVPDLDRKPLGEVRTIVGELPR
ncbi:MAG: nitroreductase family protein [Actinomycetota bacterium]